MLIKSRDEPVNTEVFHPTLGSEVNSALTIRCIRYPTIAKCGGDQVDLLVDC